MRLNASFLERMDVSQRKWQRFKCRSDSNLTPHPQGCAVQYKHQPAPSPSCPGHMESYTRHCGWNFSCTGCVHSAPHFIQPLLCLAGPFVHLLHLWLWNLPCLVRRLPAPLPNLLARSWSPASRLRAGRPAFFFAVAWSVDLRQKRTQESFWPRPLLHWDAFFFFFLSLFHRTFEVIRIKI